MPFRCCLVAIFAPFSLRSNRAFCIAWRVLFAKFAMAFFGGSFCSAVIKGRCAVAFVRSGCRALFVQFVFKKGLVYALENGFG